MLEVSTINKDSADTEKSPSGHPFSVHSNNRTAANQSSRSAESPLFPCFQPIIEVASGRIVSYEALARRHNTEGQVVSAGATFSDVSISREKKRLYDRHVRVQALQQAKHLPAGTSLAINISPQWINDLEDSHPIPTLEMMREAGVHPDRVIIELTELNGDMDRLLAVVQRYRHAGLKVAIDDFGAGFSQLDRVIALEPDIIKLDMQLFKQAVKGGIAEQVVESLVDFSFKTGARIICEGVETHDEFNFGLKCGAHYMQGFLFSRATEDFQPVDTYQPSLQQLRQRFFYQMYDKEMQKVTLSRKLKEAVISLRQTLQRNGNLTLDDVQQLGLNCDEFIRFYICNREGEQITPNFNYSPIQQSWDADLRPIGFNWAWRPYFYQLSVHGLSGRNRLTASNPYQDLDSGRLCKTMATLIDNQRVLLVDIAADLR